MSILSREEAEVLTQRILGLSHADECRVSLTSGLQANTRFADNGVTTSGDATNDSVLIRSSPDHAPRNRFSHRLREDARDRPDRLIGVIPLAMQRVRD